MERSWTCFHCEYKDATPLCVNAEGKFDPARLAELYLNLAEARDRSARRFQTHECVEDLIEEAPEAAIVFLFAALGQCRTVRQTAYLAAGLLENLLEKHGEAVIGPLEEAAGKNPKMRYLLSATWGGNRISPEVWRRLTAAVASGPVMDADPRTPAAGLGHLALEEADALRLLAAPHDETGA